MTEKITKLWDIVKNNPNQTITFPEPIAVKFLVLGEPTDIIVKSLVRTGQDSGYREMVESCERAYVLVIDTCGTDWTFVDDDYTPDGLDMLLNAAEKHQEKEFVTLLANRKEMVTKAVEEQNKHTENWSGIDNMLTGTGALCLCQIDDGQEPEIYICTACNSNWSFTFEVWHEKDGTVSVNWTGDIFKDGEMYMEFVSMD